MSFFSIFEKVLTQKKVVRTFEMDRQRYKSFFNKIKIK